MNERVREISKKEEKFALILLLGLILVGALAFRHQHVFGDSIIESSKEDYCKNRYGEQFSYQLSETRANLDCVSEDETHQDYPFDYREYCDSPNYFNIFKWSGECPKN